MEPMVSVIMPVYNSDRYLSEAVEAVIDQTYKNFELILVDDGSTDGSGKVCDKYAAMDRRVIALHKENGGICSARNAGLRHAGGKYVAFSDNDDAMLPQCLEKAVAVAEETGADAVRFKRRLIHYTEKGALVCDTNINEKRVYTMRSWSDFCDILNEGAYAVWAGIYRRDFLERNCIRFDESIKYGYEDHMFTPKILGSASSVAMIPEILYEWHMRDSHSTSAKRGMSVFHNRFRALLKIRDVDDEIGNRLGRTQDEERQWKSMYLADLMAEVCMLDMPLRKKRRLYHKAKKRYLDGIKPKWRTGASLPDTIKYLCCKYDAVGIFGLTRSLYRRMRMEDRFEDSERS